MKGTAMPERFIFPLKVLSWTAMYQKASAAIAKAKGTVK
jgi:hypothetical protein